MHITSTRHVLLQRDEDHEVLPFSSDHMNLDVGASKTKYERVKQYIEDEGKREGLSYANYDYADVRDHKGAHDIMKKNIQGSGVNKKGSIRAYGRSRNENYVGESGKEEQQLKSKEKLNNPETEALRLKIDEYRESIKPKSRYRYLNCILETDIVTLERPFSNYPMDQEYSGESRPKIDPDDIQYTFENRWKYRNKQEVDKMHTDIRDYLSNKQEIKPKLPSLPSLVSTNEPKTEYKQDEIKLYSRLSTTKKILSSGKID